MNRLGPAAVLAIFVVACGSDDDAGGTASNAGGSSAGGAASGGGGSGGAFGGSGGSVNVGGTSSTTEVCDQIDNDADGDVDEDCPCTAGQKQQCYAADAKPSEGCKWGEQICSGPDWGSSACTGASYPPSGETACCTKLGTTPKHELYDAFLAAYPAAKMPKAVAAIQAFSPSVNGQGMKWASVVVGNEIVDASNGGVITANIEKGRKVSHDEAVKAMPAGAVVVATKEDPVTIEVLGGSGNCNGVGWGWGSILYKATDDSVSEMVYLYVGFCSNGDVELFQYSEQPMQVCKAPVVPR